MAVYAVQDCGGYMCDVDDEEMHRSSPPLFSFPAFLSGARAYDSF